MSGGRLTERVGEQAAVVGQDTEVGDFASEPGDHRHQHETV